MTVAIVTILEVLGIIALAIYIFRALRGAP